MVCKVNSGRSFLRHDGGNIAVMSAFGVSLLVGFAAISVDYGMGAMQKQRAQNALDAAAMTTAYNVDDPKAIDNGILAFQKQLPPGSTLGGITSKNFEYGIWNDDTKVFLPGLAAGDPNRKMLYLEGMKPVYYNAVRLTYGTQAAEVISGAQAAPYVSTAFGALLGQSKFTVGATSIAYVPPTACLSITNVGNPWRQGAVPPQSGYAGMYPAGINFILILSHNSAWYNCGYWQNTNFGESKYDPATVGTYSVSKNGDVGDTWGAGIDKRLSKASWDPITVPDSFLNPYRSMACDFNNREVNTTDDVVLNPGVYCGGINIVAAGKNVTLSPGVYVIRSGKFTMSRALGATQTNMTDPGSGMPVGPDPSTIKTTVKGEGVTILLQGPDTVFEIGGGALWLKAPDLAASPNFGGLAIYSFDDKDNYSVNYFEDAQVTTIGTVDFRNKKFLSWQSNFYADCDIVCWNVGNMWFQNTLLKIYPGQFLPDPKVMALNAKVRRPSYPMIRMEPATAAAAAKAAAGG